MFFIKEKNERTRLCRGMKRATNEFNQEEEEEQTTYNDISDDE